MKLCKCDRCGELFEPSYEDNDFYSRVIEVGHESFNLRDPIGEIEATYDICDHCYEEFLEWIENKKYICP